MEKNSCLHSEKGQSKKHTRHLFWRDLIKRYKESGLRRKEFCHQNGIKANDLERWRYRLAKLDVVKGGPKSSGENFAEVHIDSTLAHEAGPSITLPQEPSCDFHVTLAKGTKLIVPSQFNSEALSRLLRCLGESIC